MADTEKTVNDYQINELIEKNNFSDAAKRLIEIQKETWETLSSGYRSLKFIKTKSIRYEGFRFDVQYNPQRYNSTSAIVDDKTISERVCFLCRKNLPKEQEGIIISNYILLANPFPIFPEHFTISNLQHKNQRIKDSFGDLLLFSKILSKHYTIFYNGPQCGASAPDHLHFQAGSKNTMPMDNEYNIIRNQYGEILSDNNNYKIYGINDGLRKIISIEGTEENRLTDIFESFYEKYSSQSDLVEPMMNIICLYEKEKGWRVLIMLRTKHRPEEFFMDGAENILFSPAACDYGGLCITPLEKDFNRLEKRLLNKIFNEIGINDFKFRSLAEDLRSIK